MLCSVIQPKSSCKDPAVAQRPSAASSRNLGGLRSLLPHDSYVIKVINPPRIHVLSLGVCFNRTLVHHVLNFQPIALTVTSQWIKHVSELVREEWSFSDQTGVWKQAGQVPEKRRQTHENIYVKVIFNFCHVLSTHRSVFETHAGCSDQGQPKSLTCGWDLLDRSFWRSKLLCVVGFCVTLHQATGAEK